MRGSTLLPWLLVGPLIAMAIAHAVYSVTGHPAAKVIAIACLAWLGLLIAAAFVAGLLASRRRRRERS